MYDMCSAERIVEGKPFPIHGDIKMPPFLMEASAQSINILCSGLSDIVMIPSLC